jgi:FkbM family methyltransferase
MNLRSMATIDEALTVMADPNARLHFSQFGEDVIIWSLLQALSMLDSKGFYVDIGALHPTFLSNTKMLNLMGWRGVNIDANAENIVRFERERPNDVNVVAAISDEQIELKFDIYDAPAVTTADPRMSAKHAKAGVFKVVRSVRLQTELFRNVLAQAVPAGRRIDLMSIDIEGFDLRALRSNDWTRFAPFFLLIEDHEMSLLDRPKTEIFNFLKPLGYRLAALAFVTSIYVRDQV